MIIPNNACLCYADDEFAYFTTQKLEKQWGDDWDDAPYEHNAGTPYDDKNSVEDWKIFKVLFPSSFSTPVEYLKMLNTPFSVKQINTGVVAWLWDGYTSIYAGCTYKEFIKKIKQDEA